MYARSVARYLNIDGQLEPPCSSFGSSLIDIRFEDDESGLALDVFGPEMDIPGMYSDNDFIEGEV